MSTRVSSTSPLFKSLEMKDLHTHVYQLITHLTKNDKKQNLLVLLNVAHSLMNVSEIDRIKYKLIAYTIVDKLDSIKYDKEFVSNFKKSMKI